MDESKPEPWLRALFPSYISAPFAPYHLAFWDWVWSIQDGQPQDPFVAVWPRGGGKSTNAELACAAVGALKKRRYGIYVSGTQEQADKHVDSVATVLESDALASGQYSAIARPLLGKYGNQRGWRRSRLRASNGFTIDALGLDTAIRGVKVDFDRPDLIVLDDVDEPLDTTLIIDRKLVALTRSVLPAIANHGAVLAVQNLVNGNGIFARMVNGSADFLVNRTLSGPYPALLGMEYRTEGERTILTAGTPTWEHMGLMACQKAVDTYGLRAFLVECQHDIDLAGSPRFNVLAIRHQRTRIQVCLPTSILPDWCTGVVGLSVWEMPRPGEPYVAYADCAEGKGQDYTVTVVLEARTLRHVATLRDNTREPGQHAAIAVKLCRWYNNAFLGVERAKGEAYFHVVGQEQYSRIYWHQEREQTMAQMMAGSEPTMRRGFPMTQQTKVGLIDDLAVAIESFALSSPDAVVWDEVGTYIVTERGTMASPGNHDDMVYAVAGAVRMARQPGAQTLRSTGKEVRHEPMYEATFGPPGMRGGKSRP